MLGKILYQALKPNTYQPLCSPFGAQDKLKTNFIEQGNQMYWLKILWSCLWYVTD